MAENVTPVVLKVKDFAPREVLLVNYKFNQATDQEGQVAGIVRGGQITIRVKALNDGNPELLAWMLDPAAPHDLEVEFENTKDGSAMKTLKGTACYSYITRSTGQTVRSTTRRSCSAVRSSRTVL